MRAHWLGLAVIAATIGGASVAEAGLTTVDLSPYVTEGFNNGGWFIDSGFQAALAGTTFGNQGSTIPFNVANTTAGNNFWFGLASGTALFGAPMSFTVPVTTSGVTTVYTLADNTYGLAGNPEFNVVFAGSGGTITDTYVGAFNTKDYNYSNCATTGCDSTPAATNWYDNGNGQALQIEAWALPANFGLQSITFNQLDGSDGAIVAGVTLFSPGGVPEPATWGAMILGLGLAGASLRGRRQRVA